MAWGILLMAIALATVVIEWHGLTHGEAGAWIVLAFLAVIATGVRRILTRRKS